MTSRDIELDRAAAGAFTSRFGGVMRIDADGAAPIFIDGRVSPPVLSGEAPDDSAVHCVWRAERETIYRIFEEERALGAAFVSGRLAISGDMSVMARLRLSKAPHG